MKAWARATLEIAILVSAFLLLGTGILLVIAGIAYGIGSSATTILLAIGGSLSIAWVVGVLISTRAHDLQERNRRQ